MTRAFSLSAIYSTDGTPATSFYQDTNGKKDMACGLVDGNAQGSYLTMISGGGLMFGIINIIVSDRWVHAKLVLTFGLVFRN
jgi:hypothetical protein